MHLTTAFALLIPTALANTFLMAAFEGTQAGAGCSGQLVGASTGDIGNKGTDCQEMTLKAATCWTLHNIDGSYGACAAHIYGAPKCDGDFATVEADKGEYTTYVTPFNGYSFAVFCY